MSYLLDTNVVSETRKRRASSQVLAFLTSLPSTSMHISVLTLGEMRRGVAMKAETDPILAAEFADWLSDAKRFYDDRILPVTGEVADQWGKMSADRSRPVADTLIAATALVHDLTLVTRNERDFVGLNLRLINPWN